MSQTFDAISYYFTSSYMHNMLYCTRHVMMIIPELLLFFIRMRVIVLGVKLMALKHA